MNKNHAIDLEELEKINGGAGSAAENVQYMGISCPDCGRVFKADVMKPSVICPNPKCRKIIEMKG